MRLQKRTMNRCPQKGRKWHCNQNNLKIFTTGIRIKKKRSSERSRDSIDQVPDTRLKFGRLFGRTFSRNKSGIWSNMVGHSGGDLVGRLVRLFDERKVERVDGLRGNYS